MYGDARDYSKTIRAKQWLLACFRTDLVNKTPKELYDNFKICGRHFEDRMFTNPSERRRLMGSAVPTLCIPHCDDNCPSTSTQSKKRKNTDDIPQAAQKKVKIISDYTIIPVVVPDPEQTQTSTGLCIDQTEAAKTSVPLDILQIDMSNTEKLDATAAPLTSPASTQTAKTLTTNTPRKVKLRQRLKDTQRQLRKKPMTLEEKHATLADFNKLCDKFLPPSLSTFVKLQAKLHKKTAKGRRYPAEYKQLALAIYFLGPRAYNFLKKLFYLPSKRCLQRMTEKLVYIPGLDNEFVFNALQIKMNSMDERDKHCILCIDEMALKANLFYNLGRDEIVGFTDIGNDNRELEPACNAAVIMARGLYEENWKQPLAYFFVKSTLHAEQLKDILQETISKLAGIGVKVEGVVTDMGSNFVQLANVLGVTPDDPEVVLGEHSFIYLFDTPHLLKATRNNLMNNNFEFDNQRTSWQYILDFANKDKKMVNRYAPKLSHSHLHPTNFERMKVPLAVQVLSHSVASGMETYIELGALPPTATPTMQFVSKFNHLFDMLNSSLSRCFTEYQQAFVGSDFQLHFLSEMCQFIKQLKVYNSQGADLTNKMKFLNAWLITINGIKKLWSRLQNVGFRYLMTRRVNQDGLENFFGNVRQQGGNCVNPTPIQFVRAFKKLFVQDYFHSERANCDDDYSSILTQLKDLNLKLDSTNECEQEAENLNPILHDVDVDYRTQELPEQNSFVYVCGYLMRKCLAVHKCTVCEQFGNFEQNVRDDTLFTFFRAYDRNDKTFGSLHVPHLRFLNYIYIYQL